MSSDTTTTSKAGRKVTLRAADGEEFEVEEAVARESQVVRNWLEDNESDDVVTLPTVEGKNLGKILNYCARRVELRGAEGEELGVKELGGELVWDEENQSLKELIVAAHYLDIKELQDMLSQAIADRIKNKSVEYARAFFGVDNDFTPEEEAALRQQHAHAFEGVDED